MNTNPYRVLGLHPGCSMQDLKNKWRVLASIHHPDKGGDTETFIKLRVAYKQIEKILNRPKKCPFCDGSGIVVSLTGGGFNVSTEDCEQCDGKGRLVINYG